MRSVAWRPKYWWSGSVQWCQTRTHIPLAARISATSPGWRFEKAKENTPRRFFGSFGPMSRISCGSVAIFDRAYSTRSFSYDSIALYPPMLSIYSIAARSDAAQAICGVPGSWRYGSHAASYHSWVTKLIAPPPQSAGFIFWRRGFFP